MSDYERMVSYFYRYANGTKTHNVGFGKVERRGEQLRITLHLMDETCNNIAVTIYLYRRKNGNVIVQKLGTGKFENGSMVVHEECESSKCLPLGMPLSDYEGIVVYANESCFFASLWSEEPLPVASLVRVLSEKEEPVETQTQAFIDLPEASEKEEYSIRKYIESKLKSREENQSGETAISVEDTSNPVKERFQQQLVDWKKETDERTEMNRQSIMQDAAKEENDLQIQNSEEDREQEEEMSEETEEKLVGVPYLLKYREHLPDVFNHTITRCVRIKPEDIGMMERANWGFGNNSFVLHGYYNNHYLMLGVMQYGDGKQQYVLGVPGVFSNRDKYLAEIFHFSEFVPQRSCEWKTGEFGYWIAKLK